VDQASVSGFVQIHRKLLGHPAFRNDAEAMAFAWLVVRASWKACRVRYKDRLIELGRGQLAISVRDFAAAMDRDKAWIERLLKRLRSEAMIETRNETGVNVVTICKYAEYQAADKLGETPKQTPAETGARQAQDTEQLREEVNKISSEANASGGEPPDPVKELFDLGVSILTTSGSTEKQARSLIGKWRKSKGEAVVLQALLDCRARSISNPVEWLEKRFHGARYVSASGYEYRGDDRDVMREAEKRADWNVYWSAKKAAEGMRATA
jgi:DNA-binding transcriptional regulator YhcF (GntR family)